MTSALTCPHLRFSAECPPGSDGFAFTPPDAALFNASKVVIVSNGRYAIRSYLWLNRSSHGGVKTVVVGGQNDVKQATCGLSESTDYSALDTDIKVSYETLVKGVQGITWRSSFGVWDTHSEWQDHPAGLNLALTPDL
ncbi:hypothetical protein C8F04DRAFT_1209681 [Mycena alexandri]|uniref:Uncharacterized protein n=1 Tax=Mycena alexandri TaxID=1745969 RepID=A0AAD6T2B0_9AGAR|nr:hypothetical protein C8F04DRAFT_1209681 [Mycena alexandri]